MTPKNLNDWFTLARNVLLIGVAIWAASAWASKTEVRVSTIETRQEILEDNQDMLVTLVKSAEHRERKQATAEVARWGNIVQLCQEGELSASSSKCKTGEHQLRVSKEAADF